jgi:aminoglycoside phosphotransferase family enzyme
LLVVVEVRGHLLRQLMREDKAEVERVLPITRLEHQVLVAQVVAAVAAVTQTILELAEMVALAHQA